MQICTKPDPKSVDRDSRPPDSRPPGMWQSRSQIRGSRTLKTPDSRPLDSRPPDFQISDFRSSRSKIRGWSLDPQTLDPHTLDPQPFRFQISGPPDPKSVARDSKLPDSILDSQTLHISDLPDPKSVARDSRLPDSRLPDSSDFRCSRFEIRCPRF